MRKQRVVDDRKFIVGLSYQLLSISNNSCHSSTELAFVPDLKRVLDPRPPAGLIMLIT